MVISAPTPFAKSKEKYSVIVTEDTGGPSLRQCSQYLPVFLENREHFSKMFYHCTLLANTLESLSEIVEAKQEPRKR